MSKESAKPPVTRKAPAFKPPRPVSKPSRSAVRRKSAPTKSTNSRPLPSDSSSDDEAEDAPPVEIDSSESSDHVPSPKDPDPPPTIPPKLLTKLVHHHFEKEKTRIGKDASALVGKYMETFVREAIARAECERSNAEAGGVGRHFLEVRNLRHLRWRRRSLITCTGRTGGRS